VVAAVLGAAAVLAAAPATLGQGTPQVNVVDKAFEPASKTISTGDTVVWRWSNTYLKHSVTANPGQAESFNSDPGAIVANHPDGYTFPHTFTHAGTYSYYCRVHASEMKGTITVVDPQQTDTTPPSLSKVSVRPRRVCPKRTATCHKTRAVLRFTLSEAARVVGHIDRRRDGHWSSVRGFHFDAKAGKVRRRLRVRGLEPGRYRVRLGGHDASGNDAKVIKRRLRVRRP
jgi:plastocyanin